MIFGHSGFSLPGYNKGTVYGFHGKGFLNDDVNMAGFRVHSIWECCCLSDKDVKLLQRKISDVVRKIKNNKSTDFAGHEYPKGMILTAKRSKGDLPIPTCHGQSAHFGAGLGCPKISDEIGRDPKSLVEGLQKNKFCRLVQIGDRFYADQDQTKRFSL